MPSLARVNKSQSHTSSVQGTNKIILVCGSLASSIVNFRGPLIRKLIDNGHTIITTAPDADDATRTAIAELGVDFVSLNFSRRGLSLISDIAFTWRLQKLMRASKADLILTYTAKPNIWGSFAAAFAGIPSVAMVTGLGFLFNENDGVSSKARLARRLGRILYRFSAKLNYRLIFQNEDDLSDFIAAGCLPSREKARLVAGSGVDLERFKVSAAPKNQMRFLMIARLIRTKGVAEYSQAAAKLKVRFPDAEFILVGPTDDGPDAISRVEIEEWKAQGLQFGGPTDDVVPYLNACNVFVLPSYREGTPRSALEAMAVGRPVITTDVPGCREVVIPDKTGFLVPARDVDALVQAMEKFLVQPELQISMGRASWGLARSRFDVKKVNLSLMQHLDL